MCAGGGAKSEQGEAKKFFHLFPWGKQSQVARLLMMDRKTSKIKERRRT